MKERIFERGELVSGQYEIRDMLGAGSMGQVFDALDTALNRRVAIKAAFARLPPSLLKLEAQAVAAVRHPCVATVHAFGEHRGVAYFVMERLLGETLEDRLMAHALEGELFSIADVLDVLAPLAEALAAVHSAGIAHRDVKPANVMLTVGERVVLTDFGVVTPERAVSRGAAMTGTAGYAAPEVIAGTTAQGNAFLVDAYALGVIAFELVTGRRPFEGESDGETLSMHLRDEVPSLSDGRDDVPPLFEALVRELLEKDPLDRPQSMASVATRLRDPAMRSMTALRSSPPTGIRITLPPPPMRVAR